MEKIPTDSRVLAGISFLPLLLLAVFGGSVGGVMTETGASDAVLGVQGWIVGLSALGFVAAAIAGLITAFTGNKGTFVAFAALAGSAGGLALIAIFGFATWCSDCGSA